MNSELPATREGRHAKSILRAAIAAALIAGVVLIDLWGTRWTLPKANANAAAARCEFSAFWNGTGVPGGAFDRPMGIAVAPGGDVYVTDARERVVHLDASGRFVGEWGRE